VSRATAQADPRMTTRLSLNSASVIRSAISPRDLARHC
jgi:hypothetical protein